MLQGCKTSRKFRSFAPRGPLETLIFKLITDLLLHLLTQVLIFIEHSDIKENCKQGFHFSAKTKQSNKIDCSTNFTSNEKKVELDSDFSSNHRVKNMNRLLIGNLNTNSISNKYDQLKLFVGGKVDILVITETS